MGSKRPPFVICNPAMLYSYHLAGPCCTSFATASCHFLSTTEQTTSTTSHRRTISSTSPGHLITICMEVIMVSLPFLATLSKEAQDAYLIAEYLLNNPGTSIGRAAFQLSKGTWDAARLANGLAKVTQGLKTVGSAGGDFARVQSIIAHGQKAVEAAELAAGAGGTGVVTRVLTSVGRGVLRLLGRQAVSTAGAMAAGAVVTTVVLGAGTYWGANYLGSRSADASVLPGAAMNHQAPDEVQAPVSSAAGEKYAVFLLPEISGGEFYVGQESTLKGSRSCDMPYGGLCDDPNVTYPPVQYSKASADYDTYDEALAAFCAAATIKDGYWGRKAEGYGVTYWAPGLGCP